MKRKRNHWRILPGGRLTVWKGSREHGIPPALVLLGRSQWVEIHLGRRTGWRPMFRSVRTFGPLEIETWPAR